MNKVTVIGAGNVGATVAECVARKDMVQEVVLVDIVEGMPQGKALDMMESGPIHLFDTRITGTNTYDATAGSDICVITAGLPRRPGMSRDDLLATNAKIVRSVTEQFVAQSPNAIVIIVSNPLDVMTYVAYMTSGFPSQRVMGMAGVLDTARYRAFIALELGVSVRDIKALLMGGHGDTMVPLPRYTTVNGIPITQLIATARIEEMVQRTRDGGAEVVNLLKTSGYYAAGASLAQMAEAIILDKKRLLACSAHLTGQYGIDDLYIGVPIKLGAGGIEEIFEIELTDDELQALQGSAQTYREGIALLGY
ncbi:MAG: malate dehydrogenase [Bacteroidetes bacterium]|nr:malate dehydrogenase [Bacteroidota bacterium]